MNSTTKPAPLSGLIPAPLQRALDFVIDRYFTVDTRTLALFRVCFGVFLLGNLYDRMGGRDGAAFYTDDGILPVYATVASHRDHQWSLLYSVTTQAQLHAAIAVIVFVYVAYTVGWHTRLMQFFVVVAWVSIYNRNLLLENGGSWVGAIAAVGSAFLPLGERFSIDSLRLPRPSEHRVARLAYGFLTIDFGIIYLFNALHKTGAGWKDGTGVWVSLWHTRVVSPTGFWVREHMPLWISQILTRGTIFTEVALSLLILSPLLQRDLRRTAIFIIVGLHGGFAVLMSLGPFAWAMMCMSALLVGTEDWEEIEKFALPRIGDALERATLRLESVFGPRVPPPELSEAGQLREVIVTGLRDTLTIVVATAAFCSILHENRIIPQALKIPKMPEWAGAIVDHTRIVQKWVMFSPDVPRENTDVVIDGELASGEHVDPLTGRPPDFESLLHPSDLDNSWRDYLYRISWDKYKGFVPYLRDWVFKSHRLPGALVHEPIVHVDIWAISMKPPKAPGLPHGDIKKRLLLSGNVPPPRVPEHKEAPAAPPGTPHLTTTMPGEPTSSVAPPEHSAADGSAPSSASEHGDASASEGADASASEGVDAGEREPERVP